MKLLKRFFTKKRRPPTKCQRRLLLERLDSRLPLAVGPLGVVTGSVFTDLANDSVINSIINASAATVNDPTVNGVDVSLFLDNNSDGAIDGGDTLIGTDTTSGSGTFRFEGLSAGDYLLSQDPIAGMLAPTGPVAVTVIDDNGQQVVGIDDYSEAFQLLTVATAGDPDASASSGGGTAATILGGERDLRLSNTGGADQAQLEVDGQLNFSTNLGVTASAVVQYDGVDGSSTLNPTGLAGTSLSGGDLNAGLLLGAFGDLAGGTLTVSIFSDATNASETSVAIPAGVAIEEFFIPFSSFTTVGGAAGPADFTNVGAIEATLSGVPGLDARVSVLSSHAPVEVVQNLANIQPVSVGNLVWRDENDNAIKDPAEPGIVGVDVNLYRDSNSNGSFDFGTDTLVNSTVTGAGGAYQFTNLVPGDYLIQVPESEFAAGQPLFGFGTSLESTTRPDPDDNVDDDDNGNDLAGQGVVSSAVTLFSLGEPITDGDTDPDTNFTVDFGFVPEHDLVVTKTLQTVNPVPGGEVDFLITVTNNGPIDATTVNLVDTLPAGLTFNRLDNVPGGVTTSVVGSQVSAAIPTLAVGAGNSVSFNLIADVASGAIGTTFTNQVVVTADGRDTNPANDNATADVVTPSADLRLTKTDDVDPVGAGQTLTYTLQVFNDGPDDATGVVVTDTLPGDVTFVSGTIGGSAVGISHSAGVVTANVGNLTNGSSQTISIVVTVLPNAGTSLTNTATVSSTPSFDSNAANDTAVELTSVVRDVDLQVSKTASANPIAGQIITYTFDVQNNGPGDARGVTVTDTLNALLTLDSFNAQGSGVTISQTGNLLTFDVGTLASSSNLTFSIDVLVGSNASGLVPNSASVATTDNDTNTANNTSLINTNIGRQVDLAITKDDNVVTGVPGQSITYTLNATNNGPSDASGVRIVDTLPANFSLTSVAASGFPFTNSNGVITFTVGDLVSGASASVSLTGTIVSSATGTLENNATVSANETDLVPGNNSANLSTTLSPQFDLVLTKSANLAQGTPGQPITYTVNVSNNGPSDATNVVISDTLPSGVTFSSGSVNGTPATVSGSTVTFNVNSLAAGSTASATLIVDINSPTTGTLTNLATVASDAGDTNGTNNSDSVDTPLVPSVDLTVAKTVSDTIASAGTRLTYQVTVTNSGPSTALNVTATDILPAGVSFVSGSGPVGQVLSATGQTVAVNIGTLDGGQAATFTIVADINAGVTQTQTNNVSVATTMTETNNGNNTASAATVIDLSTSSIAGIVYLDRDDDGIQDAGESGLADVTINLTGTTTQGQAVSLSIVTDANGNYSFTNLAAGNYEVQEIQPTGLLADGQETLGQNATANVAGNGFTNLSLGVNTAATEFNFGELVELLSMRVLMSQNCSFVSR